MRISAIISAIEAWANPAIQEKWDNTGLQLGSPSDECRGVLVCLDVTPAIVDEAIKLGCNLIVSHHPLFFKPVKRLTGSTPAGATAINAIAAGITIYSTHTAADSTRGGVSYILAEKLGIKPLRALAPLEGQLVSLRVTVPRSHAMEVQAALFDAGAGSLGNYDCCSFAIEGTGTFRPLPHSNPTIGKVGQPETVEETELSVVLTADKMRAIEQALLQTHPYETPAYQFAPMLNTIADMGLGIYGIIESEEPMTQMQFAEHVKKALGCQGVRTSAIDPDPELRIRRVAVCGGAGGEFIGRAIAMGAQAYVTADVRYHDFVDYRSQLLIIDAGHFDTEAPFKDALASVISEKFPEVPVHRTSTDDNPINFI